MLNSETFDFVLTNELKRAQRSQNFVTLVQLQPRAGNVGEITHLVGRELRETDMLAADATTVSMVLLDADVPNSNRVIERVMTSLENYQFATPCEIAVGAACCPTHGADVDTLKRVASQARK